MVVMLRWCRYQSGVSAQPPSPPSARHNSWASYAPYTKRSPSSAPHYCHLYPSSSRHSAIFYSTRHTAHAMLRVMRPKRPHCSLQAQHLALTSHVHSIFCKQERRGSGRSSYSASYCRPSQQSTPYYHTRASSPSHAPHRYSNASQHTTHNHPPVCYLPY